MPAAGALAHSSWHPLSLFPLDQGPPERRRKPEGGADGMVYGRFSAGTGTEREDGSRREELLGRSTDGFLAKPGLKERTGAGSSSRCTSLWTARDWFVGCWWASCGSIVGLLGRTFILASIVIVSLTKSVGPAFDFPYLRTICGPLVVDCGSLVGPFWDVRGPLHHRFSIGNTFLTSCGDFLSLLFNPKQQRPALRTC